jgi:hypothetical protein
LLVIPLQIFDIVILKSVTFKKLKQSNIVDLQDKRQRKSEVKFVRKSETTVKSLKTSQKGHSLWQRSKKISATNQLTKKHA